LEILKKDGELIKSFSSKAKDKKHFLKIDGIGNRHLWDMRYDGFKEFPGMVLYSSPNVGPKAVPGEYVARLIISKDTSEQTIRN